MSKPLYALSALMLTACAATSDQTSMSQGELVDCLQPNRRVMVEVGGLVAKPPPKKPQVAAAAPAPQVAKASPDAAPAKAAKPKMAPYSQAVYVQGNHAFDPGSATLKEGGKQEIDKLLANLEKRAVQVNSIIISGHTDRLEAESAAKSLSEARAKAVKEYLVSKGASEKVIFWEGKEARDPVAVTKFCT